MEGSRPNLSRPILRIYNRPGPLSHYSTDSQLLPEVVGRPNLLEGVDFNRESRFGLFIPRILAKFGQWQLISVLRTRIYPEDIAVSYGLEDGI
jgi:hypothetical protein